MAFMSVYSPSPRLKPYSANAARFHLARDWTISALPPTALTVKLTGF